MRLPSQVPRAGNEKTQRKASAADRVDVRLVFGVDAVDRLVVSVQFKKYIEPVDHWIAFALLVFIGVKMIAEAFKGDEDKKDSLNFKMLLLMSLATSIDALVVGITFVATETNVWIGCSVIGAVTFAISAFGVFLGNKVGNRFSSKAEIFGGAVLILIGLKILLEHLGMIAF